MFATGSASGAPRRGTQAGTASGNHLPVSGSLPLLVQCLGVPDFVANLVGSSWAMVTAKGRAQSARPGAGPGVEKSAVRFL